VEASDSLLEKDLFVQLDQIRVVSVENRIHSVASSLDDSTIGEIDDALKLSHGLD
jgi:mRNA interferase MazF